MALFESYDRRIKQIEPVMKKYGINLKIEKWISRRVQPIFTLELDLNISEHLNF